MQISYDWNTLSVNNQSINNNQIILGITTVLHNFQRFDLKVTSLESLLSVRILLWCLYFLSTSIILTAPL